jgi:hypothetical protein
MGDSLTAESFMRSLHAERTTRNQLRLIYNDRIVSRWLNADATLGDVGEVLCELGPRHYGHPIAIDVTLTDLPAHSPSFDPMPAR